MKVKITVAVLAGLALVATARAQGPYKLKTGATGKLCLECHVTVREQLGLRSVHTPVRSGDCSDCHNPHSAGHGQLLASDASEICSGCHEDIVPPEPLSIHQAILDGSCVTCHDPHAADNPNTLVAAGNQLCFDCHKEIAATVEQSEFKHNPAARNCLSCHDPHASTSSEFLLKKEMGALCGDCHDVRRTSFVQRHMGYPVAGSRCTSCHDPHGSDTSGILLAEVHEPVTNRMCNQCHLDPSSPNALMTKTAGVELCRGCHSRELNQTFARNRLHWPVADRIACLNCHSPHASNEKALLHAPTKTLCGSCHQETVHSASSAAFKHQPIEDGECAACHAPHAADHPFLMETASVNELCGTCHDWQSHSSHPLGSNVTDQRNMNLSLDCQSCHRAHGSDFKGLSLMDPDGPLCVQCHEQMSR